MKSILCFGDSLTYGADPTPPGGRHAFEDRWPSALESALGTDKVRVIAEGLGGRTTVFDDWYAEGDRNGSRILPTLLASHTPLDLIAIMLGTNDIKPHLGRTAAEAGRGMVKLAQIVRGFYAARFEEMPPLILIAPPLICETDNKVMMDHFGGTGVIAESTNFSSEYKTRATEQKATFFDASTVATASPHDGVHLDAANTRAIGEGLAPVVRELLGL